MPAKSPVTGLNSRIGGRRIGLDVAACKGFDIFPRRVFRSLDSGASEDHLLLERQLLVHPELLVHLPDSLGVDDADLALGAGR